MMPILKPGQEILVSSLPYLFSKPKEGQIVAFKEGKKFIVKRIKMVAENKILVSGDNSNDSKEFGWIGREKIIGKVIYP